jgi:serine/threonine-protein kinase
MNKDFLIGEGGQSDGVYIGLGTDGSEKVVKCFNKPTRGHLAEQEKDLLKKCEAKDLRHVVKYWFLDEKSHRNFAFLIMELCEETLAQYVARNNEDDLIQAGPNIVQQILEGLAGLHRQPNCILHRDLKPSNILRDVHGKWLLADFGIGRMLSDDKTMHISEERGTKMWKATESCSGSGTTDKSNVNYKAESDIQVKSLYMINMHASVIILPVSATSEFTI